MTTCKKWLTVLLALSLLAASASMVLAAEAGLTDYAFSQEHFTVHSWQNSGNAWLENNWINTKNGERFLVLSKQDFPDQFSMSFEMKPGKTNDGNLHLESFIGIGVSGIPAAYDSFDFIYGHGIFVGEVDWNSGNVNIRMNRVANGFKGWLTIDGVEGDNTMVVAEGLLAGATADTVLVAEVSVDGDTVKVQLSRKDDASRKSPLVTFNMSNPTSGGDTTRIPESGKIAFACNGWLSGAHYGNLKTNDSFSGSTSTEPPATDPVETQPPATAPVETDPVETDPIETQPAPDESKLDYQKWDLTEENFTLLTHNNLGNAAFREDWIVTDGNQRFAAVYNGDVPEDFSLLVELKPINNYLESFVGIRMSGIPSVYDGFDALTGYGIFVGEVNASAGSVNIRMNRVADEFKGWMPIVGEGNDYVTVKGLLKGMEAEDTLTLKVTIQGNIVRVLLYRTDDPALTSPEVVYDLSKATTGGYSAEAPANGKIVLACNGWLTGSHYTNVRLAQIQEKENGDAPAAGTADFTFYAPYDFNIGMADGWITTYGDQRFMAVYKESMGGDFSLRVQLKPAENKLASIIGIHVSEIPEEYAGFDACYGYGIYIGDYDTATGDVSVRLSKSVGVFRGWIPTVDGADKVTVAGLLADADENTTLTADVSVIGDRIQVRLSRTDDPEKASDVIVFDITAATSYGDETQIRRTGCIALAGNAELTGSHFAGLTVTEPVDMAPNTDAPGTDEKLDALQGCLMWIVIGAAALATVIAVVVILIVKKKKNK